MSRERTARRREENEVEFSRIVAFSDGVFAIAITLLVLNLSVPAHISGNELNKVLWDQRQDLFAYVISFAVFGRFWIVHHRFFGSVVGFDGRLLGRSTATSPGRGCCLPCFDTRGARRPPCRTFALACPLRRSGRPPDAAPAQWLAPLSRAWR